MKRKLITSKILVNFEGDPIKTGDNNQREMTLKDGLLIYIRNANRMGLSDAEQNDAFVAGVLIGHSDGEVTLTTAEYNAVRKLCEDGKLRAANGQQEDLFNLEVKKQLFDLVDQAEGIKEEAKAEAQPK